MKLKFKFDIEIGNMIKTLCHLRKMVQKEGESDESLRARRQSVRIPVNDSLFTIIEEHFLFRMLYVLEINLIL